MRAIVTNALIQRHEIIHGSGRITGNSEVTALLPDCRQTENRRSFQPVRYCFVSLANSRRVSSLVHSRFSMRLPGSGLPVTRYARTAP